MADEPAKPPVNGLQEPPSQSPQQNGDSSGPVESTSLKAQNHSVDVDAQDMVINSLRTQIQDLFSQVNELNNKLVKSYDRVSDLEDDIHVAASAQRAATIRISQLEMERTQHLAALNTGLLVEKSHVTTELNRLMEKATEEAAQRGQAESAREAIEKDLDDLSASLFNQANTMVAEARFARHLSEQKVIEAQRALKGAEEAVGIMQTQMQRMKEEKDQAEKKTLDMQTKMGKGKWLDRIQTVDLSKPLRLMSSHTPYQEFLLFIAHLRVLHQTTSLTPAMTTILPLPFLSRLSIEDSDPTIRLDLAPSLNWLSRRSILSAIHTGQLTIEPIPVASLLSESPLYSSPVTVAGLSSSNDNVSCALCGSSIAAVSDYIQHHSAHRQTSLSQMNYSWSGSFFKKSTNRTSAASIMSASSHPPSPTNSTFPSSNPGPQVYIFRAAPPTASISSLPIPTSIVKSLSTNGVPSGSTSQHLSPSQVPTTVSSSPNNQPMTIYPLCSSGWCLGRLRSTCTLWAYVRTGIVEKVWEEENPAPSVPPSAPSSQPTTPSDTKPPLPPRKRGLWGLASAIGERATSWTDTDGKRKAAASSPVTASSPSATQPPPLPPRTRSETVTQRRLPPLLPPEPSALSVVATASAPPPLPKRSNVRKQTPEQPAPLNGVHTDEEIAPPEPMSPAKLLFDAADPQSPVRTTFKRVNQVDESAGPAEPQQVAAPTESNNSPPSELPSAPALPPKARRLSAVPAQNLPLPDSRPATPAANGGPATPAVTPSPSATAIPVAAVGPPPPLPRRAAARRPVPGVPSRSVTPQQAPEVKSSDNAQSSGSDAAKASAEENRDTVLPDAADVVKDTSSSDGKAKTEVAAEDEKPQQVAPEEESPKEVVEATKAVENAPATAIAAVDRSSQSSPDSDIFVDALSAATTKEEITPTAGNDQTSTTNAPGASDGDAAGGASAEKAREDEATQAAAAEPAKLNVDVEQLSSIEEDGPPTAVAASPVGADLEEDAVDQGLVDDKEVYVGETTWEERTWKELVRLREDMFWARVGGLR